MRKSVSGLEALLDMRRLKAYAQERAEMAENRQNPNERAYVYRKAINKTSLKKKKDAGPTDLDLWVRDPLAPMFEPGRHFLWLTRPPGNPNEDTIDEEVELFMKGCTSASGYLHEFPASARQCSRTRSLWLPQRASAPDMSPTRVCRNRPFPSSSCTGSTGISCAGGIPKKNKNNRYIPRAYDLGLSVPRALTVEDAPTYREKVFDWAEEITEWLGI